MKKVTFGVVGLGHIGKRHADLLDMNPNTELMAICDIRSPSELNIDRHLKIPFYSNLQEMLEDNPHIEVVCIATPNGLHASQAILVLKAHKHVIIEKPMALKRVDCEQILYQALTVGKQVFCVMQNRYSPPIKWLKEIVDADRLGKIFQVEINCYWNRNNAYYDQSPWRGTLEMDGGPLFTQFSHFIDLIYWLFGDIKCIHTSFGNFAHKHNTAFEDAGIIQFQLEQGALGCLSYSTASWQKNFESSISIIAEKGTLKIGGQYMDKIEYCHIEDYTQPQLAPTNPPNDYGPYKGSAANHHYVFENVISTLAGQSSITTNALEGMKVVEIIERIYKERQ